MQIANLNQLVQQALQELDYIGKEFVCTGVWCGTTSEAYKRFLIDEGVDPHFAGVRPEEGTHLPKTLRDYIFGAAAEVVEAVVETAENVIDLIAPDTAVVVNIGELSTQAVESKTEIEQPALKESSNEQQQEGDKAAAEQDKKDGE